MMITKYLKKVPNFNVDNIESIEEIDSGFTNQCFKITMKNQTKLFFRLATEKTETPRQQEHYVQSLVRDTNLVWYDIKTGNMLKKWVEGTHDFVWDSNLILRFIHHLNKLHSIKYDKNKILVHDHTIPTGILSDHMYNRYISLVSKYKDLPLMFCHNDLNPGNIILLENEAFYIYDFEWSRLNTLYWELANFARENLNQHQMEFLIKNYGNLDKNIFKDFLFITSCYAIYWSYLEVQNEKTIAYRDHVYNRLLKISGYNF